MQDRLQELDRQLLLDEDDEEDVVSTLGSVVTTTEWSDVMHQLRSSLLHSSTAVGLGSDNKPSSTMQDRLQELER